MGLLMEVDDEEEFLEVEDEVRALLFSCTSSGGSVGCVGEAGRFIGKGRKISMAKQK